MHYDQKYNVLIVEHLDNRQEHVLDGFKEMRRICYSETCALIFYRGTKLL